MCFVSGEARANAGRPAERSGYSAERRGSEHLASYPTGT